MTHWTSARACISARYISEDAEVAKVAEKGDSALPRGTSALRDLSALRVLGVKARREAGNASMMEPRP
jgi:hypothetical protein